MAKNEAYKSTEHKWVMIQTATEALFPSSDIF